MDKKDLKDKFREYLQQEWKDVKTLDQTVARFNNNIFNIFLNWLESYKEKPGRSYSQVFLTDVVPQMKNKLHIFWDYYFKDKTYKKYEALFINFMQFAWSNSKYINELMFESKKGKLENLVEWQYWNRFDKKVFLETWHNYIKEDKGPNWDKLRWYLADIYWFLKIDWLKTLYDIFFDSYEICSKISSKNNKNKWKENYEKRDAFNEAFSNLQNKLPDFKWEKLGELKSLFWKYLNFLPKYRETIISTLSWDVQWWKAVQKATETMLYEDIWEELNIVEQSRDKDRWIYDRLDNWDIIAPVTYWIFPENNDTQDNEDEVIDNNNDNEKNDVDIDEDKREWDNVNEDNKGDSDNDPNQDKLYRFDSDNESWWNR